MTEQRMMEQRMTEQNGHEERERNNARDGDAGLRRWRRPNRTSVPQLYKGQPSKSLHSQRLFPLTLPVRLNLPPRRLK